MKPSMIRDILPILSQSVRDLNPQLSLARRPKNSVARRTGALNGKRGVMNKTESEFALILEAQKRAGESLRYEYEGITLRWADMRYTPDFVVFCCQAIECPSPTETTVFQHIKLIEVKGGHIWDRDIVRYKGARAYWPEFAFEMWQLKKGQGWKRKY